MKKELISLIAAVIACGSLQAQTAKWGGPYAGVQVGSVDHKSSWYDMDNDWSDQETFSKKGNGISYGINGGYNVQLSQHLVVGVQGEYNFSSVKKNERLFDDLNKIDDIKSMAAVRGKFGFAFDNAMAYVTLGVARVSVDHKWIEDNDYPDSWDFTTSKFAPTYGAGIAFKLNDRISANMEYQMIRAVKETEWNHQQMHRMEVKDRISILQCGVTYHF